MKLHQIDWSNATVNEIDHPGELSIDNPAPPDCWTMPDAAWAAAIRHIRYGKESYERSIKTAREQIELCERALIGLDSTEAAWARNHQQWLSQQEEQP